ncbi:putative iron-sulfur-binding reductase domain protein [Mycobacterium xenopi 4042]|uniref:Putative iron-sulfur-binding reductase domain protein n=1 Tax=Mycobacterium xenopi 4042 TaxID=1299334 RepID=X7ZB16_MYCXE|nr:putative iron-sulfur-binding reductase domain protein [Mycobacterium xenopi 4042]
MCSSIHIRAPPAPQQKLRSACRGISVSDAPEAPISSRGAS